MPHYFSFRIMFEFCSQPFYIHSNISFLLVLEEICLYPIMLVFIIITKTLFRNLNYLDLLLYGMCMWKVPQLLILNNCTGQGAGRKTMMPSEGVIKKSYVGMGKRNLQQQGSICTQLCPKGQEEAVVGRACRAVAVGEGPRDEHAYCQTSTQLGGRERGSSERKIPNPAPALCAPAGASFIQTRGSQWAREPADAAPRGPFPGMQEGGGSMEGNLDEHTEDAQHSHPRESILIPH